MSWVVRKRGNNHVVLKQGTKNVVGSHKTREEANAQVKVLMSHYNSPDALKKRGETPDYKGAAQRRSKKYPIHPQGNSTGRMT